MCGMIPSTNPDYPLFAYMETTTGGAHTEAQLIPQMRLRARENNGNPTLFYLYSRMSPCGASSSPSNDCNNKVFDFAATDVRNYGHYVSMGFRQWYTYRGGPNMATMRDYFCDDVTTSKRAVTNIDFADYLEFWKILNQKPSTSPDSDLNYNPGTDSQGARC